MPDRGAEPEARRSARRPAEEGERAGRSLAAVAAWLRASAVGSAREAAAILEAQALLVEDAGLHAEVEQRIRAGRTAERAVFEAFARYAARMTSLGGVFAERAADLRDLSRRVVAHLAGEEEGAPGDVLPGYVLVARDLAPADLAMLSAGALLAIVTCEGGPTSHTAVVARERGIPAVVAVRDALALADGTPVVVDADAGEVRVGEAADGARSPAAPAPAGAAAGPSRPASAPSGAAASAPPAPGALADGTPVALLANLGSPGELGAVLAGGAEGIGLLRTELLFPDASSAPGVAEQRAAYGRVFAALPGRRVVVRVLDAGADKPLAFLSPRAEPNPALGLRGLRALRAHEPVLRDQLAAIALAASDHAARVAAMAPLVATVEEARYFVALAHEAGVAEAGIMIEVPAAALLADRMLAVADFASIGTNDLAQYALAADRTLGALAELQDPWQPAVLRLVAEACEAGVRGGRPVGVCGEAAADPLLAVVLVGLGATSLSMAPPALADVRRVLARHDLPDARRLAEIALAAEDARAAREAVRGAAEQGPRLVR